MLDIFLWSENVRKCTKKSSTPQKLYYWSPNLAHRIFSNFVKWSFQLPSSLCVTKIEVAQNVLKHILVLVFLESEVILEVGIFSSVYKEAKNQTSILMQRHHREKTSRCTPSTGGTARLKMVKSCVCRLKSQNFILQLPYGHNLKTNYH